MRRWWFALLALAVLTPEITSAQEKLSLEEAMSRARQQAHQVKAASARASAAGEKVRQAKGFRLPSVTLEESFISTNSPAEAFAFKLNQERFDFGSFMVTDPNDPKRLETGMTRLQIQLPIYTGGELSGRIRQAELAADAAAKTSSWAERQAALEAAEAYVMLAQAREYVGLLQKSRDTVKAHVDLARSYEEQGMLVRSEVMRAEVELSRVEDMLTKAEGDARTAAANLAFRMATDLRDEYTLAPLEMPSPPAEGLDAWLATSEQRPDLESARTMLAAGELEPGVLRAAYLPKVGLVARGDLFDDRPFGTHGDSTTFIAAARWNLWQGGAHRAAVAAARWQAEAGREDVQRFTEGVRLEVTQAYQETVTAQARHETAAKALQAAREAERITEERFKSGVVKMIDLIDATTARREAETRELVARADAVASTLRLAVKAGREPESVIR